jgi:hypothetical protein
MVRSAIVQTDGKNSAHRHLMPALLCACFSAPQAYAQPAMLKSGTPTCTVSEVADKPTAVVELSCNLKALDGISTDYSGSANTRTGGFPPGKHIFMWSVVAVGTGKMPLLDGTFTAEPGRQGPPVLVGGTDGSVRLEPVTGIDQPGGPAEITTLTLKLAATKA